MKVLKFGGTSVGTVESLRHVKSIVESLEGPVVVVVSALGGLTDKLIATAAMAARRDENWLNEMSAIRNRHFDIINQLVPEAKRTDILSIVSDLLDRLSDSYKGLQLIGMLPDQVLDLVVSFGERISSHIVAAIIDDCERKDSLEFVKTEKWNGKNIVDRDLTETLIRQTFSSPYSKIVIPGFISTDKETGFITNLGRGGSDFTGALVAAALDAEILEIWTDVDGFMTADPRIVKEAFVIPYLSFTESMELCTFGAKVIYPPTIYPVFHKNIPIKILNTFNKTAPGTLITDNAEGSDTDVKGVTPLRNSTLFSIITNGNKIDNLRTRALNALSKNSVRIFPVENTDPSLSFSFITTNDESSYARNLISEEFAPEFNNDSLLPLKIKGDLSVIAMVGNEMRHNSRLLARVANTLARAGINVEAFSLSNSDTTLTVAVEKENTEQALNLIHSLLFRNYFI